MRAVYWQSHPPPPPLGEPEWRMGPYLRLISTSQILFLGGLAGKPSEGSTQ